MSRASIPPMTSNNSNPRLHLGMDALKSKLYGISFLQKSNFRMDLVNSLVDTWFRNSPRELFQLMMMVEYKWRSSLNANYENENEALMAMAKESVAGFSTGGNVYPDDHSEEIADTYYKRGWDEGRENLKDEILGDATKIAIKGIISDHRMRKSVGGLPTCNCMRGVDGVDDWANHVALRVMNYLKNEFPLPSGGGDTGQ